MQAIREIHTVKNGKVNLTLPEMFWDTEVEIIVLAKTPAIADKDIRKVRGSLSQYANPELIETEKTAWEEAAEEKHRVD